jgi:hypothetical protein
MHLDGSAYNGDVKTGMNCYTITKSTMEFRGGYWTLRSLSARANGKGVHGKVIAFASPKSFS